MWPVGVVSRNVVIPRRLYDDPLYTFRLQLQPALYSVDGDRHQDFSAWPFASAIYHKLSSRVFSTSAFIFIALEPLSPSSEKQRH